MKALEYIEKEWVNCKNKLVFGNETFVSIYKLLLLPLRREIFIQKKTEYIHFTDVI